MEAVASTSRYVRIAFGALCAVAVVDAIAVAFVLPRSSPLVTTYGQSSRAASALELTAGFALLAAGAVAWRERLRGSLGALTVLLCLIWFAPDWIGWENGSPLARSLAMVALPFALALVLHIAVAAPRGRVPHTPAGAMLAPAYTASAIASVGLALFRDPFDDPYCWSNCADNVFLVHSNPGVADALDTLWRAAAVTTGVLVVIVAAWRLERATGPGRGAAWPVLVPAALVGAAEATYAVLLLRTPLENPNHADFALVFGARAVALVALAGGVGWTAVRSRRTRAGLAHATATPTVPLRDVLSRALGDPKLQVAYPLPGSGVLVEAAGTPAELPAAGKGRAITRIERGGEPVAIVAHDASLLDGATLERDIGAAARLAVDNERLQASVLAHLADLRASRTRIIETGDAARRRLERDLHDGAQQRLLALSYELRLALAEARAVADDELVALLAAAGDEAQVALAELRDLAHGIHPAILADAGLEPALATVADTAPIPVELGEVTPARHPETVETAAYLVAVAGIEDAARRGATHVAVNVVQRADRLRVWVADDGAGTRTPAEHLADRVGALGGRLEVEGSRLEAEIPCA
ncbi:MAG TPA: histidine kinase [Thermoleophilaceae bacterium]|nr:histidine kinase [Thermoleophilaceae bacterium]